MVATGLVVVTMLPPVSVTVLTSACPESAAHPDSSRTELPQSNQNFHPIHGGLWERNNVTGVYHETSSPEPKARHHALQRSTKLGDRKNGDKRWTLLDLQKNFVSR